MFTIRLTGFSAVWKRKRATNHKKQLSSKRFYASSIQTLEDYFKSDIGSDSDIYCAFNVPDDAILVRYIKKQILKIGIKRIRFKDNINFEMKDIDIKQLFN